MDRYQREAQFHRPSNVWFDHREVPLELNATPSPFVDWTLFEAGKVGWADERDAPMPLKAEGLAFDEDAVRPVPIGAAYGVALRSQPARERGRLFEADRPWEEGPLTPNTLLHDDGRFRLWYRTPAGIAYAESGDGRAWEKPALGLTHWRNHERTNLLPSLADGGGEAQELLYEGSLFRDPNGAPDARYKAVFMSQRKLPEAVRAAYLQRTGKTASPAGDWKGRWLCGATSPDGLRWRMLPEPIMPHFSDTQSVVHFDESLGAYVGYFRVFEFGRRCIARAQTQDFASWPLPQTVLRPGSQAAPYEDYYLNAFGFYPGRRDLRVMCVTVYDRSQDNTCVRLATSRDGVFWDFVPGEPLVSTGAEGEWDGGCVFATLGLVATPGDEMLLLYQGYHVPHKFPRTSALRFPHGAIGFARWPKDRLVALEASEQGEFTTHELRLAGERLALNASIVRGGEVRVELLDDAGRPVPGRTFDDADPITGDDLNAVASWRGEQTARTLGDRRVTLRVRLRGAKLFSLRSI